jgi:hypothetical protein
MVKAGKRLIEMALSVDPIFAAELSRLCGGLVWKEIRGAVAERLRSWYGVADENHRQCSLAGMLASGSDDFSDIILPLLTSDDQQVRLGTYRAGTEFHPSTLGAGWRSIVKRWNEDARIGFITEVTRGQWMPEIVEDFALADPSPRVRAAAVQALSWVGSSQDMARLLEALDEEVFRQAVQTMAVEYIPPSLHPRALVVYQTLLSVATDPLSRLRFLMMTAELGDTGIAERMKNELSSLPPGRFGDAAEYVIRPAINIMRKLDPQWVSQWVADRIVDGSLWHQSWVSLLTSIPEGMKAGMLEKIGGEDLQHGRTREIIAVLAATADPSLAVTVFSKLCAVQRSISDPRDPANQTKWAIARQLENLLRALPPNVV